MGQLNSCFKPAADDCGSEYKYDHRTPPQSLTTYVENRSHAVGVGKGDVDGEIVRGRKKVPFKKKKRFWRWAFSHLRGGKKSIKTTSGQGCEEDQGTEAAAIPSDGPSVRSLNGDLSADVHPIPIHSVSDWSFDVLNTPVNSSSDWSADVQPAPVCYPSDWSTDVFPTPPRSLSYWSLDLLTPVHSESDWSINSLATPVCSASDWSTEVLQTSPSADWSTNITSITVRSASDWSIDIPQTPAPTGSDWSVDILQTPVSTTEGLESLENDRKVAKRIEVINSRHYETGDLLGEGGFGAVYEGTRLEDGLKVAVKFVTKTENVVSISIPGHPKPLPVEIALMILANEGPRVPEIIELLDWQDRPNDYIMVLEQPSPCEDLFGVAERHGGSIDENLARVVMGQATNAALMCCQRGVLHGDIKLENLLFNQDTLEVKLIDFGCGDLLANSPYDLFIGTDLYCPPEYTREGKYHGEPATVWSLGVLLFALVCGDYPSDNELDVINANLWSSAGLSKECCHLIGCLLQRNPEQRIQLGQILLHDWFKVTGV